MATPQDQQSLDQLKQKLGAIKKVHYAIIGIFMIIILAWLILGYWKDNIPVFISTIAMTVAISGALLASRSGLSSEISKREREQGALPATEEPAG